MSELVDDANELVWATEDLLTGGAEFTDEQADAVALLALVAGQDVGPGNVGDPDAAPDLLAAARRQADTDTDTFDDTYRRHRAMIERTIAYLVKDNHQRRRLTGPNRPTQAHLPSKPDRTITPRHRPRVGPAITGESDSTKATPGPPPKAPSPSSLPDRHPCVTVPPDDGGNAWRASRDD